MTKQRALIKDIVAGSHAHLSAQQVFELAKNEMPAIAMATVYNNLNALEEAGEIKKMRAQGRLELYDGCLAPHAHTICTKCGRIEDIHTEGLLEYLRDTQHINADSYELNLYLTCSQCREESPLTS